MTLAYLAVGSNLGDRLFYLSQARQMLCAVPKVRFLRTSRVYETDPVGGPSQGKYMNAVWEIETDLSAQTLLEKILEIEKKLGRVRAETNGPRTLDLDILFYGDEIIDTPGLHVPHPRLHTRGFVLRPLMDLCPNKIHPQLQKTVSELWREQQGKR